MSGPTTTEMFSLAHRHLGFAVSHERCPPRRLAFEREDTRAVLVLHSGRETHAREIQAQLYLERHGLDAMESPIWLPMANYPLTLTEKEGRIRVGVQAEDDATMVLIEIVTHLCWAELEDHLRRLWDEYQD